MVSTSNLHGVSTYVSGFVFQVNRCLIFYLAAIVWCFSRYPRLSILSEIPTPHGLFMELLVGVQSVLYYSVVRLLAPWKNWQCLLALADSQQFGCICCIFPALCTKIIRMFGNKQQYVPGIICANVNWTEERTWMKSTCPWESLT